MTTVNRILWLLLPLFSCETEKAVTAFNAAPEALITSHSDGSAVLEGYAVEFRASLTDANHETAELEATWYVGGEERCP